MKNTYEYVAIFDYAEDGINIYFPDLPGCFSCADDTKEALKNAGEILELYLVECEEEDIEIPNPTPLEKIKCKENEKPILVSVWMPLARSRVEEASVKKTLTLPSWLNELAEEMHINFSQVLQAALKDILRTKGILKNRPEK